MAPRGKWGQNPYSLLENMLHSYIVISERERIGRKRGKGETQIHKTGVKRAQSGGFPGGAVVESPPADAGDTASCPGLGRSHMPRSG